MKHAYYGNLALAAIVCFYVTVRASPTVTSNFCYEVLTYTAISEESYTPSVTETVDMLLVGGGGGGGGGNTIGGGGGGGGGVLYVTGVTLTNGVEYKIVVGQGGANGTDLAANGGDSFVATYEEGGVVTNDVCRAYGGGGGGATMPGANSTSTVMGNGGDGLDCGICGDWHCYGSGGGAGNNANGVEGRTASVGGKESGGAGAVCLGAATRNGVSGVDGLGGGGGGGGYYAGIYGIGGRGGSGCVILRYRTGDFMLMLR